MQEMRSTMEEIRGPLERDDKPAKHSISHSAHGASPPITAGTPNADPTKAVNRESFVRLLLVEKGWSTLDWAQKSNVDFHTADNYLKGKTSPCASTRRKLASSLGIAVADLPG